MSTVTIGVDSDAPATARPPGVMKGEKQGAFFITFESPELLFHTLTPLRWNIIRTMMGAGPLTLREVARRVERDLPAVQWDVHALLDAGVLERTGVGAIVFPYDAVHVDFVLKAASTSCRSDRFQGAPAANLARSALSSVPGPLLR